MPKLRTDAGDVIAEHVAEAARQFPDACGLAPPRLIYRLPSVELFDELVARLELWARVGEGFAMSPAADRLQVYLFAPGTSAPSPRPSGRRRRR